MVFTVPGLLCSNDEQTLPLLRQPIIGDVYDLVPQIVPSTDDVVHQ
jgi:hypothetical protein